MSFSFAAQRKRAVSIALAPDPPPAVEFAARELSRYLAIITGARFPIEQGKGAPVLRLGVHLPNAPDLTGRKRGSLAYQVAEDGIAITGTDGLAVLHAVYTLLEELGCVWLHAWEGGEIIPRNLEASLPLGTRLHEPAMVQREFTNLMPIDDSYPLMIDWMAKNRFNRFMVFANLGPPRVGQTPSSVGSVGVRTGEGARGTNEEKDSFERYTELLEAEIVARGMQATMGHHSFRYFLPPGEFFEDHPEYYALLNGERNPNGQLCTSNPEVVRLVAERVCRFFSEHPHIEMIGLWPNDGFGWCECERCQALEPQRPSFYDPNRPRRTDTYLRFVNAVAERVAEEHPGRRLSALAYVNYVEPPEQVEPAENVAVCFAPFKRCIKHTVPPSGECERNNEAYGRMLGQWREKVSGDLYLFCYLMQIQMCSLPYRITHMLGRQWQLWAEAGVDGYVMEFIPEEWGTFGVNAHLIGRLSWDPALDVDAWLGEYYKHLFGPAAEEMGEFYRRYEEDFILPGPCTGHYDVTYTARASDELLRPAMEAFGRARAAAATGEKRHWEATERVWVGMELLRRFGAWQRLVKQAEEAREDRRAELETRARQNAGELLVWAREHADSGALEIGWLERMLGRATET